MNQYPSKGQQGFQKIGKSILKRCKFCNDKFMSYVSMNKRYCSRECIYMDGRHKLSKGNNGHIFIRKHSSECVCLICGKKFLKNNSSIKNGEGKYCSRKCMARATSKRLSGKNCPFWKHGKGYEKKTIRNRMMETIEYRQWRRDVFKKDNFECQLCSYRGNELVAHHKKSWASYLELRFSIENGVTLCKKCHYKVHTKQYIEKYHKLEGR